VAAQEKLVLMARALFLVMAETALLQHFPAHLLLTLGVVEVVRKQRLHPIQLLVPVDWAAEEMVVTVL
jgi:hypothetical protein